MTKIYTLERFFKLGPSPFRNLWNRSDTSCMTSFIATMSYSITATVPSDLCGIAVIAHKGLDVGNAELVHYVAVILYGRQGRGRGWITLKPTLIRSWRAWCRLFDCPQQRGCQSMVWGACGFLWVDRRQLTTAAYRGWWRLSPQPGQYVCW